MKRLLVTFDVEELDWGRPRAGAAAWEPCAPSAHGLEAVLGVLEESSLPATFFCTAGFARACPELVRKLVEHGHEVASHGLDHRDDYRRLPADVARDRLDTSRRLLEDVAGVAIRGVRTPRLAHCPPAVVAAAGFTFDASPHPTWVRGGLRGTRLSRQPSQQAGIVLVPLSVLPVVRLPVAWYVLRVLNARATSVLARLAARGTPWVHLYFHPWEGADLRACLAPHPLTWRTGPRWVAGLRRLLADLAGSFPAATVGDAVDTWLAGETT